MNTTWEFIQVLPAMLVLPSSLTFNLDSDGLFIVTPAACSDCLENPSGILVSNLILCGVIRICLSNPFSTFMTNYK